ncbi:putative bifunctional diguanylate cyclase/phosphodiesterase [Sporolactobacillus nakayamae]|uniref:PAS domain S-box-containing protein/diguanylate cyclase (GGDEF) domain-containing protein n=1 Tax=Sporolactobacillus nakayamae TaxID=269670 RepID=A0A1I2VKV8_9BACL|nr:GGDEF domain-containing phosphodiesterase [Sporolactobacillus nakayamae]SFG89918.1 PAS domain S-box-containing protein/diguanylate cyclase (GGDEF) domain-containing protein [Sporolactobacillus nakayamae]
MSVNSGWLIIVAAILATLLCAVSLMMFFRIQGLRVKEESEKIIRKITDSLHIGAYIIKGDSFIYVNNRLCELTGYSAETLKQMKWQDVVSLQNAEGTATVIQDLREGRILEMDERLVLIRGDGARMPLIVKCQRTMGQRNSSVYVGTADVEERAYFKNDERKESLIDPVTELPGSLALRKRLEHEILENPALSLALVFVDIDSMNRVNDTIGRDAGDRLLQEAAKRLKECEGERVYHYRGDEFAILFKNRTRADVKMHIKRIMNSFTAPIRIHDTPWYETITMGVSFFPEDADNGGKLIDCAIASIHYAKKNSRGKYEFYNPGIINGLRKRLEMEMDLRHAVKRNEFTLHYQPQIDLRAGAVVGSEALIRWIHPVRGIISPGVFIPMAEELGLIEEIGEWVLRTACRQTKQWNDQGYSFDVSVNISPRQLFQENLVGLVQSVLTESGLMAEHLQLEITETAGADLFLMSQKLQALEELGVRISIDDFGTGYNSLNYLKQLPLSQLKIDQSFIRGNRHDHHDVALVRMIVALAQELDLQVVAEGVETPEHVQFLKQTNCALAQGYLFARPLSAERFIEQLNPIQHQIRETITPGI